MLPEQREFLDESLVKIRSGRITRRTFIERAMAVGLSSSAAASLMAACGGSGDSTGGNGASVSLIWQSENDTTPTYKNITDYFNANDGKKKGIHVTWHNGPNNGSDLLTTYTNMLRARRSNIDVMSIDVVYPALFGDNEWTVALDDKWSSSARSNYLPGPLKACTYNDKIWAAPYRTDLGLLYYRTDLVSSAPTTWDDLVNAAKSAAPAKVANGFIWQGAQYEGLVCNFVEALHSYGGDILDAKDSKKVIVNSPEANEALSAMVGWIGSISPDAITTYQEPQTAGTWTNGSSVFARNWPYMYTTSADASQSKVVGKFDIASLPYGGKGTSGHSAIGGWNLAINAYSKNTDQAWEFVNFMLGDYAQKQGALGATWTVTSQKVYDDAEVLQKWPQFAKFKPILQTALPRPVSAKYSDVTQAIQRNIFQALKKQAAPSDALKTLESDLKNILK